MLRPLKSGRPELKALDCVLTLVLPQSLEEEVVDDLLRHPEWASGFTITQVEGKGSGVRLRGAGEEVRGRARRVQLQAVMNADDARALVAHLRGGLAKSQIAYWIVPAIEFGRFV